MKKKLKNISSLFIFITILILSSCSSKKNYDWTILVYMATDNSLSQSAISDINEMEAANFDEENIKIIVLSDLLDYPGEERLREDSRIFDIHHDNDPSKVTSPTFEYTGEYDTGDYNQLTNFVNWGYKKFPSIHKALFISSHGDGWYSYHDKFCIDQSTLNFFNIPNGDLKNAFDHINYTIDILGLDACNMQTMEVFSELQPNVGYVISSEYEIRADGFPYMDILNSWQNYSSNKSLSINIADKIYQSYTLGGSQNPHYEDYILSFSSFDFFTYKFFINDLKDFLNMNLEPIKEQIVESRNNCTNYVDQDYSSQIDIMQFFKFLQASFDTQNEYTKAIDKIIDDLDREFIYSNTYLFSDNMGYATVWFPTNYNTYKSMFEDYSHLQFFQTGWNKILKLYFSDNVDKNNLVFHIKN